MPLLDTFQDDAGFAYGSTPDASGVAYSVISGVWASGGPGVGLYATSNAESVLLAPQSSWPTNATHNVATTLSVASAAGGVQTNAICRYADANNYVQFGYQSSGGRTLSVYKNIANSFTLIGSYNVPDFIATGAIATAVNTPTTIAILLNGTQVIDPITLTDSSILNGLGVGFRQYGAGSTSSGVQISRVAVTQATTPGMTVSPTTATAGTPGSITLTGSNTSWTSGTTFSVTGGTGASLSAVTVNVSAQTATATLNPGSAAGTLVLHNSTDSGTANVTVAAPVAPTTTILANDPNIALGYRQWAAHPTIAGAVWCGSSGAQAEVDLLATANISAVVSVADSSATHTVRWSLDKGPWQTATIHGGQTTTIPILASGTSGRHSLKFDAVDLDQGAADLAGKTSTPSCLVLRGFVVDQGSTTAAYFPAAPAGRHLVTGTSYEDSGGVSGALSIGAMICAGLDTFGGSIGISGSFLATGGRGWSNYQDRILHDPGGASALVNGQLVADSVTILTGRNDTTIYTGNVQTMYSAIRAVYAGPLFLGPDASDGGGYPISVGPASEIRAAFAAIQSATPDPKFLLLDATPRMADGLNFTVDGTTALAGNSSISAEPAATFSGAGDGVHVNAEYTAKIGAHYAAQIAAGIAAMNASGSGTPTAPTAATLIVGATGTAGATGKEWVVSLNAPAPTGGVAFTGTIGSAAISGTVPAGSTAAYGTYTAPAAGTYTPTLTMGAGGSGIAPATTGAVVISAATSSPSTSGVTDGSVTADCTAALPPVLAQLATIAGYMPGGIIRANLVQAGGVTLSPATTGAELATGTIQGDSGQVPAPTATAFAAIGAMIPPAPEAIGMKLVLQPRSDGTIGPNGITDRAITAHTMTGSGSNAVHTFTVDPALPFAPTGAASGVPGDTFLLNPTR